MSIVNDKSVAVSAKPGDGRDAGRNAAGSGGLALARRTARLTASTGLAGSLTLASLTGSAVLPGNTARAQVVDVCSGLSLDASLLRDRIVPFLQAVVNPIQATVNPLLGNVVSITSALTTPIPIVGPILGAIPGLQPVSPLSVDASGILAGVAAGDPIGLRVVDTDGVLLGPGSDCVLTADGFELDGTTGISIGGNAISGLGSGTTAPAVARTVDSIAFGDNAQTGIGANGAIALGTDSNVGNTAVGAIAIGDTATVGAGAAGSIALGAGAGATAANSVALGAGSLALRGAQPAYTAVGLGAGRSSTGEVAIGGRALTGVAPGSALGDAVNVEQLTSVANSLGSATTALGGGAAYDPATGLFTAPEFVLGEADVAFDTVGGALENLDGRTISNTTNIATNTTAITNLTNGTVGLLQQLDPAGPLTIGVATGGGSISVQGTAGPRNLTGLAAGAVAAGSTEAVTGGQLFATNATIGAGLTGTVALIGAGASYDPVTGVFTPPAFLLGEADVAFDTVGGALENLDGRTISNTTNIANLANGTVGLVQQLVPGGPLTIGAATDGGSVSILGTAGPRTLTGLQAGALAAGSTEAVTGGQLFATNATIGAGLTGTAALIGAGASYDPATGVFTPPTFLLGEADVAFDTVGAALENLDGRTIDNTTNIGINTTAITNLSNAINNGSVGLVQQLDPTSPLTVGASTGGTSVNFLGTAGPRVLTGIGTGTLSAVSTDAVTGAQLFATNTAVGTLGAGLQANAAALGGTAAYDPATGVFTPPSYLVQGAARANVGDALDALDGQVTINTSDIANLQVQIGNGTVGLVQQAAPGADLTVGAATNGNAVRFNQTGGATRLVSGLSDGAVAAGSTDAVTGGQAFATGTSIASALGGGAALAADGTISAPTYTIGGTGFTDAGSAFAALDASVTGLQNQNSAFDPDGNLVYVSVSSAGGPARATGTETVAIGGNSVASGSNSAAYGSNSAATGAGSSAFGAGATAGFDNSAAFGAGATATRANQIVLGTGTNTYTMPGITSAASRSAQSGPVDLVTTDAAGNLASVPLGDFFSGVSAIEAGLQRMDSRLDRQSDGIAIAMALGAVALPSDKSFAITGSIGYFDDTAAFGVGAIGQIADSWYVNGGVGVGTERGTVAGRAGLTYAW